MKLPMLLPAVVVVQCWPLLLPSSTAPAAAARAAFQPPPLRHHQQQGQRQHLFFGPGSRIAVPPGVAAAAAGGAGDGGGDGADPKEQRHLQQHHPHTRRRRPSLVPDEIFLGNLTRVDLMGWDVLEPEEEGYKRLGLTVPDVKASDFRDLKVSLRFGFEGDVGVQSSSSSSSKKKGKPPPIMVEFTTPWALCYPPGTRARGCQELITPQSQQEAGGGGAPGLPCTVPGGSCPYVKFSCARGHTWMAEPGTPACFYCPRCREQTRNVRGFTADNALPVLRGRKRVLDPAARFRQAVIERGGLVLGSYVGSKTKTRIRCSEGHEWQAIPENVLRLGSWCPECAKRTRANKRALTLADMQALAEEAGGKGARCLSEKYEGTAKPLVWSCAGASGTVHTFSRTPNYIKKGLAVGRAFCVECEKKRRKDGGAGGGARG